MVMVKNRLHFLDALRAFAILMMLQGHFVHALLAKEYQDNNDNVYRFWEYFRGITAPVFFTITGFVFIFLLIKNGSNRWKNPRVRKGLRRGVKLVVWGYLLRLSLFSVFDGTLNASFFYVDVLQCIGISLILLVLLYLVAYKLGSRWLQSALLLTGVFIFIMEPLYSGLSFRFLPVSVGNYFTQINGSVFTIFPWFGYACFGGYMAIVFTKYRECKNVYIIAALVLFLVGITLVSYSSAFFMWLYNITEVSVFTGVAHNNFLFMRLGDVCVVFAVFIFVRKYLTHPMISEIGSRTLSIYIIHFFVLYGAWFGLGLTAVFYNALTPVQSAIGALLFIVFICLIVIQYYRREEELKVMKSQFLSFMNQKMELVLPSFICTIKKNVMKRYRKLLLEKK